MKRLLLIWLALCILVLAPAAIVGSPSARAQKADPDDSALPYQTAVAQLQSTVEAFQTREARQQATIAALQTQVTDSSVDLVSGDSESADARTPINVVVAAAADRNEKPTVTTKAKVDNPTPEVTQEAEPESLDHSVDDFGDSVLVSAMMGKWLVTVESVEVREYMGDASIVPRNGKFVVVWLTFESSEGDFFPLTPFSLVEQSATGQTFPPSEEATLALVVTEYDFDINLVTASTPYRAGVVFDVPLDAKEWELNYEYPYITGEDMIAIKIPFSA